jgi:hypothetical protein
MTKEIKLTVDNQPIELDYFVEGFIDHTTRGVLAGLEGTGEFASIKSARISVSGGKVDIQVDSRPIPANPFVSNIVKNTLAGMLSSLKGVSSTDTFSISLTRK